MTLKDTLGTSRPLHNGCVQVKAWRSGSSVRVKNNDKNSSCCQEDKYEAKTLNQNGKNKHEV